MNEVENKILQRIEEYLKEYADDYQSIVVEGGMFGDSIEFNAGYGFMKELMKYIKKQSQEIKSLKSQLDFIEEQNKYIDKLEKMLKEIKDNWNDLTEDKVYLKMPKETLVKIIDIKRNTIGYIRIKRDKLQARIDKAIMYCNEVIEEHNNGDYDVSTIQLAIKEHKGNIVNILDILKGSDKE